MSVNVLVFRFFLPSYIFLKPVEFYQGFKRRHGLDIQVADPFYELLADNEVAIMNTVMTKAKARAKIASEKDAKVVGVEKDMETGEVIEIVEDVDTMGMSIEEMMGG